MYSFTGQKEDKLVRTQRGVEYEKTVRVKRYPFCQGTFPDCPKEIFRDELKEPCMKCPFPSRRLKERFRSILTSIRMGIAEGEIGGDGLAYFIAECSECGQKIHLHGSDNPLRPKKVRNLCEHIKPNSFEVVRREDRKLIVKPKAEVANLVNNPGEKKKWIKGTLVKKDLQNLEECFSDSAVTNLVIRKKGNEYKIALKTN